MNVLEVKDLTVKYNKNVVLDNINLRVSEGDILGILGPNGAGKTTLFKAILGLIEYNGEVSIFGYKGKELKKVLPFVSYLPQRFNIEHNFPATVNDLVSTALIQLKNMNVQLLKRKGYIYTDNEKRYGIDEILDIVKLNHKRYARIDRLSGGELQRALLARVLITRAPLLILDEPFTSLDSDSRSILLDLLKMLNKDLRITMIIAAHEINLLLGLAKNIAFINKRLYYYGSKDEFLNSNVLRLYNESVL